LDGAGTGVFGFARKILPATSNESILLNDLPALFLRHHISEVIRRSNVLARRWNARVLLRAFESMRALRASA
jgi:hypothetical protein